MFILLLIHYAFTLIMTGVVWFAQVIHYPLLRHIPPAHIPAYERQHMHYANFILPGWMLVEGLTGAALWYLRPADIYFVINSCLILAVAVSTFKVQVPCHKALAEEYDEATCRRLIRSNWWRTMIWTLRALLLTYMIGSRAYA
jgi:hypothetical protein